MIRSALLFVFLFCQSFLFAQLTAECDEKEYDGVLYKVVEQMPSMKSCEDKSDSAEIKACSSATFDKLFRAHPSYQKMITEKAPQGSMYLTFVVEANGCLSNFNVRRDICEGCGEQVVNILKSLPAWNAGMSNSTPVRVMQNSMFHFQQAE